jgi:hypothetical protein
MSTLAALESFLLAAIAALHAAWGAGVRWPCRDEESLVALVVGYPRERMPTPAQCFAAAGAILAAAAVLALLAGVWRPPLPAWVVTLLGIGMTGAFAGRGVAGYLPAWRALFPRQPFTRLDRLVYSPLCLCIALTCAGPLLLHLEN